MKIDIISLLSWVVSLWNWLCTFSTWWPWDFVIVFVFAFLFEFAFVFSFGQPGQRSNWSCTFSTWWPWARGYNVVQSMTPNNVFFILLLLRVSTQHCESVRWYNWQFSCINSFVHTDSEAASSFIISSKKKFWTLMTFRQQLTQEIIHVGFRSFWIWNLMRLITLFIRSLCHLAVIRD